MPTAWTQRAGRTPLGMSTLLVAGLVAGLASCSRALPPSPGADAPAPQARAAPEPTAPVSSAPRVDAQPLPSSASEPAVVAPSLPVADGLAVERLLDRPVRFLSLGEDGRIAVLTRAADATVGAMRFERGAWAELALPAEVAAAGDGLHAGIHFGRDHRPRLMGYRETPDGVRMVYLRFIGGRWQPEPKEIGRLGQAPHVPLFGVLGNDDPEIVCKVGDVCLVKSRQGWDEVPPSLPPTAVLRAFHGVGYGADARGLWRADKKAFAPLDAEVPWTTEVSGFWVDAERQALVVEPSTRRLYTRSGGVWTHRPVPLREPRDVVGPVDRPLVVGADGVVVATASGFARVGAPELSLTVVRPRADGALVAAGPSGVVSIVGASK